MFKMFTFIAVDLSSELFIVLEFCYQTVGNKMKRLQRPEDGQTQGEGATSASGGAPPAWMFDFCHLIHILRCSHRILPWASPQCNQYG